MKILLLALLALAPSLAKADSNLSLSPEEEIQRAMNLDQVVRDTCKLPPASEMAPYTLRHYERYIGQVIWPELKMLHTAFLVGFQYYRSKNLELGFCVVTFLGLPNDKHWEKSRDYYGKAKTAGTLPAIMFAGFDKDGNVLLKPIEDVN